MWQLQTLLPLFGANCGCFCWLTALIEVFVVFALVDLSIRSNEAERETEREREGSAVKLR